MKQLSLFTPMNDQPLLTVEQLKQTFYFMENETIVPDMKERWFSLRNDEKFLDARAIASEFMVR